MSQRYRTCRITSSTLHCIISTSRKVLNVLSIAIGPLPVDLPDCLPDGSSKVSFCGSLSRERDKRTLMRGHCRMSIPSSPKCFGTGDTGVEYQSLRRNEPIYGNHDASYDRRASLTSLLAGTARFRSAAPYQQRSCSVILSRHRHGKQSVISEQPYWRAFSSIISHSPRLQNDIYDLVLGKTTACSSYNSSHCTRL